MEPLRILVAEDEALTRTILRARLEKLGHQVVAEAENGVQAVEAARTHKPDAIIMHPGPINRGVEIDSDVADSNQSIILQQVENGVAVRMAVLYLLAGGSGN